MMAEIEKHPHWLARSLDEDFGVDGEAEYIPVEARGDVLKLQFKTTGRTTIRRGNVRFSVDRKYLEYARNCRYHINFYFTDVSGAAAISDSSNLIKAQHLRSSPSCEELQLKVPLRTH